MDINKYNTVISSLKDLQNDLRKEIDQYQASIEAIQRRIGQISSKDIEFPSIEPTPNPYGETLVYDKSMEAKDKVVWVLDKKGHYMHFKEIAKYIIDVEDLDIDVVEYANFLSNKTTTYKNNGTLSKIQVGKAAQNSFWGLKGWKETDGNAKKGREYNFDMLTKTEQKRQLMIDIQ